MRTEFKPFYGHHWRTVTRPRVLKRAGGRFDENGRYEGGARCERCSIPDAYPLSVWQRSEIEVAHLDGVSGHDDDDNLAALCHTCHRRQDYQQWAVQFAAWLVRRREERIDARDAARPLLVLLKEAS